MDKKNGILHLETLCLPGYGYLKIFYLNATYWESWALCLLHEHFKKSQESKLDLVFQIGRGEG